MQNAEPIQLRQVRDFGQCITDTFVFLKQNKRMFRHALLIAVPFLIVGSLCMNYAPLMMMGSDMNPITGGAFGGIFSSPASIGFYLLGLILSIIGFVLLMASIHEYVRAYYLGEHELLGTGALFSRCLSQFWHYFGAGFLMPLVVLICVFLCVLPACFVGPVFCLAICAHAIERTGGLAAWGRSNSLVHGDYWPTVGLFIVTVIIWYITLVILQLPALLIGGGIGFVTAMEMIQDPLSNSGEGVFRFFSWFQILASIVSSIAYALTLPVMCVCMCMKYFSRVEEKEGHGLQERLANFDQA